MRYILVLGSNLGDRQAMLSRARAELGRGDVVSRNEIRILRASSVYETSPWGVENQPAFLNAGLLVETELEPLDLLAVGKRIERELGRESGTGSHRYGPRVIDIDIVCAAEREQDEEFSYRFSHRTSSDSSPGELWLQIPHPRAWERAFVREIVGELAPGAWLARRPGQAPSTPGAVLARVAGPDEW